jgi:serine/threonine protein kinase
MELERRVSSFPEACDDLDRFQDCPFYPGSPYTPVKDVSKNLVVRTYFAKNSKTGEELVIKCIERGRTCTPACLSELKIHHMSFGHPYIAALQDVFLTERYLCIVMAFAAGFDLDTIIKSQGKPLSEEVACKVFQQLLLAVKFLHDGGYNNRDLRTNNIIFDQRSSSVKLQDFMYSRHDQINSDPRDAFKSLPYTSPELLSGATKSDVGDSANIWELGVCLFKLVTGMFPFERESDGPTTYRTVPVVISRVSNSDFTVPEHLSGPLKDLLTRIFVTDRSKRIQLDEILSHPWVNSQPWPPEAGHIAEMMRAARCPVSKEVLEGVSKAATQQGMGRSATYSTEDELIDTAAADEMMQDQALHAMRQANI